MYAPASIERHYQIEVAVLWIRGIMMFACVTSFWADTRRFLQHAYSSLFGSIHHYHHHVVACACFYTFTFRAFLVLLFLAAFCWTWNRWRPFCKLGSPYTILLYCLGICAMWLALMLPPRLNLLHDNFAATFAFIICNYVFLTKCQAWSSFLNEQHGTSNTQHRSRWLWILLYFSFHMPFAFCSYWPFPLVDSLHRRRPLQLTV